MSKITHLGVKNGWERLFLRKSRWFGRNSLRLINTKFLIIFVLSKKNLLKKFEESLLLPSYGSQHLIIVKNGRIYFEEFPRDFILTKNYYERREEDVSECEEMKITMMIKFSFFFVSLSRVRDRDMWLVLDLPQHVQIGFKAREKRFFSSDSFIEHLSLRFDNLFSASRASGIPSS